MGKSSEIVSFVLACLGEMSKAVPLPFETPYQHLRRVNYVSRGAYTHSMRELQRRGTIKVVSRDGKKFLELTAKGQLRILLEKASCPYQGNWDGKWRLVIFDIPEDAKEKRHAFRSLLKKNHYYKLQASVYISPYLLNREAIEYLRKSMLIGYIRILRVDEMDRDEELKKRFFGLNKKNKASGF